MSARQVAHWTTNHGDVVTVYEATDGYRWRVRASNGEIVGTGEAYHQEADAIAAARRHHPEAVS